MDMPCLSESLLQDVFSNMDGQNREQISISQNDCNQQSDNHESSSSRSSQYTLDMIFNNLIYPDVNEGQCVTYDTLLQTLSDKDNAASDLQCSWLPRTQVEDSVLLSEASVKRGTLSGKRKRLDHLSRGDDTQKRLRCKTLSDDSCESPQDESKVANTDRRKVVPRRVGQCRR
ncbi:uncharacterized protein LOC124146665 [Haliotis rufescens]|uniref:uncharacterized protein LOC124146665 n=1 Tax=Haliotis rufescens TaxID=6454 RepID=UPI001EB0514C|nr:uncharacterized protein LOC124146665 [Haliotis rufescens]